MSLKNLLLAVSVALILAVGIFLRVHRTSAFTGVGYDEGIYANYLGAIRMVGMANYGEIVRAYESNQDETKEAIVHPLRMGYIVTSYFWMTTFRCRPLTALHAVAALAGILHLLVAGIFAWRAAGRAFAAGVTALVACAPLQICLAQRALVDGVYAFLASLCLWLLWENLRAPNRWRWLIAYMFGLFLLVMTKEYAAFVVFAFCCVIVANRWLGFGTVTPKLLAATVVGPALAVLVLVYYAGGIAHFIHLYHSVVEKSRTLDYAIKCQDGPWSRYLFDFLIVTPAVLLLAIGRVFQLDLKSRPELYCAIFLLFSYIPMASVTYGMSLRFAASWDLPLCWLAFSQLDIIAGKISARRKIPILVIATVLVCAIELWEYRRVFVLAKLPHPVYDPISGSLLEAVKIFK